MPDKCDCSRQADSATCELRAGVSGAACPTNHQIGKLMDSLTLKAIMALPLTELRPVEYRFCSDPHCPTVYYSEDGLQEFTEADLREQVYQKHPNDEDVFVCYCFRHTPESIRSEIENTGESMAIEKITAGIQAEQCACDIRNPQGSCCLGNVRQVVKKYQTAI